MKKLLSAFLSISVFAAVIPMNLNAIYEESIGCNYPGYLEIENDVLPFLPREEGELYFLNPNGYELVKCTPLREVAALNLAEGVEYTDFYDVLPELREIMKEKGSELYLRDGLFDYDLYLETDENITINDAKIIYDFLNQRNLIDEFGMMKNRYSVQEYYFSAIASYCIEDMEKLEEYIKEKQLNCHIELSEVYDNTIVVVPDSDDSLDKRVLLADQIYNDCNLKFWSVSPNENTENSSYVDMHNNIVGDANDDKELGVADVVTIMQSIADPDNNKLTDQGWYNADITGDGDGITAEDALAVKMKLIDLG